MHGRWGMLVLWGMVGLAAHAVDLRTVERLSQDRHQAHCWGLLAGLSKQKAQYLATRTQDVERMLGVLDEYRQDLVTQNEVDYQQLEVPEAERAFGNPLAFWRRPFAPNPVDRKLVDARENRARQLALATEVEKLWTELKEAQERIAHFPKERDADEIHAWLMHRMERRIQDILDLEKRREEGELFYPVRLENLEMRLAYLRRDIEQLDRISRNEWDTDQELSLRNKMLKYAGQERLSAIDEWALNVLERPLTRPITVSLANVAMQTGHSQKQVLDMFKEMDERAAEEWEGGIPDQDLVNLALVALRQKKSADQVLDRFADVAKLGEDWEDASLVALTSLSFRSQKPWATTGVVPMARGIEQASGDTEISEPAIVVLTRYGLENNLRPETAYQQMRNFAQENLGELATQMDDLSVAILMHAQKKSGAEPAKLRSMVSRLQSEFDGSQRPAEEAEDIARLAMFGMETHLSAHQIAHLIDQANRLNGRPLESERAMTVIGMALLSKHKKLPVAEASRIGVHRLTDDEMRMALDVPILRAMSVEDHLTENPGTRTMQPIQRREAPRQRSWLGLFGSGPAPSFSYRSSIHGDDGSGWGEVGSLRPTISPSDGIGFSIQLGNGMGIDPTDGSFTIGGFDMDFD